MKAISRTVVPAVLLMLAACTGIEAPSQPVGLPSSSVEVTQEMPELPDPGPPCTLAVGDAEVGLSARQALMVTALAANALRAGASPRELAARISSTTTAPVRGRVGARALLGYDGPALTCVYARADLRDQRIGPTGLTPRAEALRRAMRRAFDDLVMGGFAPGGVSTGHLDGSAHYEGRAIDVFFRPHTDREQVRRGWILAQWLVARGERRRVLSVIFRDRIWTVWASFAGWQEYVHPSGNTTDPVLRHLDHVHTAVLGGPYVPEG